MRLGRVLESQIGVLTTDVTLVGGDSGGPLLNLKGEVVGIHSRIGERISSNYHVPVGSYLNEWGRLLAGRMTGVPDGERPGEMRPLVGIAVREKDGGLLVTQVFPDSPADEAGVQPGDWLIRLADEEVTSPDELDRIARSLEPYDRVPIEVERGFESIELSVWLGRTPIEFPGMARDSTPPSGYGSNRRGSSSREAEE